MTRLDEHPLHARKAEVGRVAELAARGTREQARLAADAAHDDVGVADERADLGRDAVVRAPSRPQPRAYVTCSNRARNAASGVTLSGKYGPGRERATGLREDAGLAAGVRVEHLDVRGVRVVALQEAHVVGGGPDHREPCPRRERQQAAGRSRGARSTSARLRARARRAPACPYAASTAPSSRVRLLEQAERLLQREHAAHRAVDERDVDLARLDQRLQRRAVALERGQLHVEPGFERALARPRPSSPRRGGA